MMDTKTITINQTQNYLAALTIPLKVGEEIVIVRDKTPLAKLVAPTLSVAKTRTIDEYKGKIKMSDDFDAPLPDEMWGGLFDK